MHRTKNGEFKKLRYNGFSAGTRNDKHHPGKLTTSKTASGPSQLQPDAKPRACVNRIPLQLLLGDYETESDDKEGDDEILPLLMTVYAKILSQEEEGTESIPANYEIPCSETCLFE